MDMPSSFTCDSLLAQVPQKIVLPEPVTQVAAGHHHTLFLTESGNVWACGRNSRGQLGLGSKAGSFATIPQRLDALTGVFVRMHKGVCNLGAYTRLLHISCICCRASPINQLINQFTFLVFRTHQRSQQTITGKQHTLSTNCSRRSTIEHHRNCWSDAVTKEGASTATPHALI